MHPLPASPSAAAVWICVYLPTDDGAAAGFRQPLSCLPSLPHQPRYVFDVRSFRIRTISGCLKVLGPAERVTVVHAVTEGRIGTCIQKQAHHVRVATRGRQVKRRHVRTPARPAAIDAAAAGEQPFHCRHIVALRHEVQHAAGGLDRSRVPVQQLGGGLPVAKREERDEVHRPAARRAMSTNGTHEFRRNHRPDSLHHPPVGLRCTRIHGDRLARPVHRQRIGAKLEQQRDHLLAILQDGKVQRRPMILVAALPPVERRRVGRDDPANFIPQVHRDCRKDMMRRAATDQILRDRTMRVVVATIPARRPSDHLERVVVSPPDYVAARVGEPAHDIQPAGRRGPVHRIGVVSPLAGVHVKAAFQQEVHRIQVPRREVQQRPVVRFRKRVQLVRVLIEQISQPVDVAVACRVEQLTIHRQGVDVCLERAPARESVLPGDVELRGSQLRCGVGLPQFFEPTLRLLPKPVDVGLVREIHGDLPSS